MKAKARRDVASREAAEKQPRASREPAEGRARDEGERGTTRCEQGMLQQLSGSLVGASLQASADVHVNHSMNDERAQVERH